jgi:Uncharacterized conserved protein, contains double-stranded beta-helix domain
MVSFTANIQGNHSAIYGTQTIGHCQQVASTLHYVSCFYPCGEIENVAVAHLQSNGGGPTTQHSHPHSHLFIVTKGEAKVLLGNDVHIIHENESFLIEGGRMHSVWNNADSETVMVGITIKEQIGK